MPQQRVQNPYPAQGNNMIMASGGDTSFVSGEMLKQVSVPVETLLGAANSAIFGIGASGIVSAVATIAKTGEAGLKPGMGMISQIAKDAFSLKGHLPGVLAGTAAFAALGGVVRYSRAAKHNEWSDRYYAHLERQQNPNQSFVERVNEPQGVPQGPAR